MIDDRISSYNFYLEFKWWKNIHLRNCLILIIYLSLHLLIQYLYQVDRMCPDQIKTDIGLGPKNTTTTSTTHSKLAYSNYRADSKKNPQPIPKEEDVDHVAAEVEQIDIKVKMHLN